MTSSLLSGTTVTLAGTSYATPIVSACAATLIAAHPSATPSEITAALKSSGVSVVDAKNGLSFPRLDCLVAEAFLSLAADSVALGRRLGESRADDRGRGGGSSAFTADGATLMRLRAGTEQGGTSNPML